MAILDSLTKTSSYYYLPDAQKSQWRSSYGLSRASTLPVRSATWPRPWSCSAISTSPRLRSGVRAVDILLSIDAANRYTGCIQMGLGEKTTMPRGRTTSLRVTLTPEERRILTSWRRSTTIA